MTVVYEDDDQWAHLLRLGKVHCTRCRKVPDLPYIAEPPHAKGQRQLILCKTCCDSQFQRSLQKDLEHLDKVRDIPSFLRLRQA